MAVRPNVIDIEWPELFGEIGTIETDQPAHVRVNREVIPVVFVPGIMGSRLKRTRPSGMPGAMGQDVGMAWDPQDNWWLFNNFSNESPTDRKSQLVGVHFDSTYLEVIGRTPAGGLDPADREFNDTFEDVPGSFDRGWVGVSASSYGDVLRALTRRSWSEPVRHCFDLPVHAYGYNWSDSNDASGAKLVQHLSRVVSEYTRDGRKCERVILVTHSMGGLVVRAACRALQESNPDLVLGVVHGVQPASGAPSAYWRMRAGFPTAGDERVGPLRRFKAFAAARILGNNAAEITAVLGHMPGALQLLPNKRYQALHDGVLTPLWLSYPEPGTGTVVARPLTGDPYEEIYREHAQFYRLCDSRLLDPGEAISRNRRLGDPWWHYVQHIDTAEQYHDIYQSYAHPDTVQFYSDNVRTVTRIGFERSVDPDWGDEPSGFERWKRNRGLSDGPADDETANTNAARLRVARNGLIVDHAHMVMPGDPPVTPERYPGPVYLMTLDDADGAGDGTVPQTSGRVLTVRETVRIGPDEEPEEVDREHEPIYTSGTAQHIAAAAIENLCLGLIREQAGRR